ncbi:hypothetical protein D3C71_970860 [compost metagenome]
MHQQAGMRLAQLARRVGQAVGRAAGVGRPVRQALCQQIDASGTPVLRAGPGGRQAKAQAVQAFALMLQPLRGRHQLPRRTVQALRGALQAALLAARHGLGGLHDLAQQFRARHAGKFRRGSGRRGAHVGHEVHDGEVGFMAHAADHGNLADRHLARQVLVIETPEIFDAASAAHQQQRVHFGTRIGKAYLGSQTAGGVRPLNRGRIDDDRHLRRPASQRRQHIPQRRRVQRGDDADRAWQPDGLALAGRIEQAFGGQLLFQPQKCFIQVAQPGAAHGIGLQLVVAPGLVKGNPGADFDLVARARHKAHCAGAASEHDSSHRGPAVLEREVPMPGCRLREVGNLASHPQRRNAALQQLPHCLV